MVRTQFSQGSEQCKPEAKIKYVVDLIDDMGRKYWIVRAFVTSGLDPMQRILTAISISSPHLHFETPTPNSRPETRSSIFYSSPPPGAPPDQFESDDDGFLVIDRDGKGYFCQLELWITWDRAAALLFKIRVSSSCFVLLSRSLAENYGVNDDDCVRSEASASTG